MKKKIPQPFFLQVFPPISLYWPFSSLRSPVTVQRVLWDTNNNHSITVRLLPLKPPDTLQLLSPLFLPFSNLQRGLLFLLISQVIHSNRNFTSAIAARVGSAFLQVTASPAPHQCTSWRSKPKKTCIFPPKELLFETFHLNSNPLVSTRALGLKVRLLQWLAPSSDGTLGDGKRKIWLSEGSVLRQAAEMSPLKWLYSDSSHIARTRQASLRSH